MITIFNRKELIITYDLNRQSQVRSILTENHIPCTIKTLNRGGPLGIDPCRRRGTLGIRTDAAYEYKVYVKKEDFEKARYLINQKN